MDCIHLTVSVSASFPLPFPFLPFRWCPVLLCHLPSIQGGPFRAVQGEGHDHGGAVQRVGGNGRLRVRWMDGRGGKERGREGKRGER